jgi:hypothetical protein
MIVVRPHAEFEGDFPDDQIEDGYEIIQCGCKNVIEAIAAIMVSFGCSVGEVQEDGDHGWVCPFTYGILSDELRVPCGIFALFFGRSHKASARDPLFCRLLPELNDHLRADGRFHNLRWYNGYSRRTKGEAESPVIGDVPSFEELNRKRSFLDRLLAR